MKKTLFKITILLFGSLILFSCKKDETNTIPTVTTSEITNLSDTSVTCGGEITNDGGAEITAKGICWSTNEIPTINDSKTIENTSDKIFTSDIIGLTQNTTYYACAYATNNAGTSYGNIITYTTKSTEQTPSDEIKILSVSPTTGLIDGEYVNFIVTVSYTLVSSTEGTLDIGFNNDNMGVIYNMMESVDELVTTGSGEYTFTVNAKVKDWGTQGDFHVYVNLSKGSSQVGTWSPIASDKYVLINKQ